MAKPISKKIPFDTIKRIDGLISTSVDDCRISLANETDIKFLRDLRDVILMERGTQKSRLKVVETRIKQLERAA